MQICPLKNCFFLLVACLISNVVIGQTLELIPRIGFQYHGISYISKVDNHPSDFFPSIPEFEASIGIDIRLKIKRFTHVVSVQITAIGPSFSFRNIFHDKGIIPSSSGHHTASFSGQALIAYGLEWKSRQHNLVRFDYSIQAGIGTNKSKEAYDSIFIPKFYGQEDGTGYKQYSIQYSRTGVGIFLTGKAGLGFYNRKHKQVISIQAFWHQGLKEMARYDIEYKYGYFNYPQYRRSQQVTLRSRGTVFGVTLGVPIRILK
jgi:hypothetical protein